MLQSWWRRWLVPTAGSMLPARVRRGRPGRAAQLRFELLEDRCLPTVFAVGTGAGADFATLEAAIQSAAVHAGDTLLVQTTGAATGSGNGSAKVAVAATAGANTLSATPTGGSFNVGDVVVIGSTVNQDQEFLTITGASSDGALDLTFATKLRFNHAANEPITDRGVSITKPLTITGDPSAPRESVTGGSLFIPTGVNSVTLSHLNVTTGGITIDQGSARNTITDVTAGGVTDNPYPNGNTPGTNQQLTTTNGSNTISLSTIGGQGITVNGNNEGTATNDAILNNTINELVLLNNADGTTVQGNTINGSDLGIVVAKGAASTVNIVNNVVTVNSPYGPAAVLVTQPNPQTGVSVSIRGNTLSTGGRGAGISLGLATGAGAGNRFTAVIRGNDLRNNKVGLAVAGDGVDEAGALGNVDAGGSGGGPDGGNDFSSFLPAATSKGFFAISATNLHFARFPPT